MKKLIALTGEMGHGKTTALRILSHHYRQQGITVNTVKFAEPLKSMVKMLIMSNGMWDEGFIERMIEGDLKELPSPLLGGKSPREVMQTLGTDWGRNMVSDTLWSDITKNRIIKLQEGSDRVILIDDCRFENESEVVKDLGGQVIKVSRGTAPGVNSNHESESLDFTPDHSVENSGTFEELKEKLLKITDS